MTNTNPEGHGKVKQNVPVPPLTLESQFQVASNSFNLAKEDIELPETGNNSVPSGSDYGLKKESFVDLYGDDIITIGNDLEVEVNDSNQIQAPKRPNAISFGGLNQYGYVKDGYDNNAASDNEHLDDENVAMPAHVASVGGVNGTIGDDEKKEDLLDNMHLKKHKIEMRNEVSSGRPNDHGSIALPGMSKGVTKDVYDQYDDNLLMQDAAVIKGATKKNTLCDGDV